MLTPPIHTSFKGAMANKAVKERYIGVFPHHISLPKLHLSPLPTTKEILSLTKFRNFTVGFHNPTPNLSLTTHELHPPSSFPYFPFISSFHKAPFSFAKRQLHLQGTLFKLDRFVIPRPPILFVHAIGSPLNQVRLAIQRTIPSKESL